MTKEILWGIFIPFAGTFIGASFVLLFKSDTPKGLMAILSGSAAGVMTAASVWSLIIPAIDYSESMGKLSFLPAATGFFFGVLFMLPSEKLIGKIEGKFSYEDSSRRKNMMTFFAVTLHNFPEGLAVGMALAAARQDRELLPAAIALSTGIALQNIPEGAIISLPVAQRGMGRALLQGTLSGVVEPIAALSALLLSTAVEVVLPYLMGFAAGAMMFVVMGELADEMKEEGSFSRGIIGFAMGFCVMMSMDVALS